MVAPTKSCTCAGAAGGVVGCVAGNGVDGPVTVEDVLALATANTQTHNCQGRGQASERVPSTLAAQGVSKHTGNSRISFCIQPNFYTYQLSPRQLRSGQLD